MSQATMDLMDLAETVRAALIEWQHTHNWDLITDEGLDEMVEMACEILGRFHAGSYDDEI